MLKSLAGNTQLRQMALSSPQLQASVDAKGSAKVGKQLIPDTQCETIGPVGVEREHAPERGVSENHRLSSGVTSPG